jgi:hypothetical protein
MVPWGSSLRLPMLSEVFGHAERFDVVHCHLDYGSFPFARMVTTPALTTLHGRLDITELLDVYRYSRPMRWRQTTNKFIINSLMIA